MIPDPLALVAQAVEPGLPASELARGFSIAMVGLLIVYVALVLISVFIALLPRVLGWLSHLWPEVDEHHGVEPAENDPDEQLAVLAAIGFVLHTEFQRQLSSEPASKASA